MQKISKAERKFTNLFKKAVEHQINGSVVKAQHLYRKALKIQDNADCHINLGLIDYTMGKVKRAEERYRKAIELNPNSHQAWLNLGAVLAEKGELLEAASAYAKSHSIRPTPTVLANLGELYAKQERYAEAMEFLMAALDLDPNCAQAIGSAAMVAWSQNRFDEALEGARLAIAKGADLQARVNLGLLLLSMDQWEEGWREYSWRFAAHGIRMRGPESMPIWTGREKVNGALYVWPEQGIGDEILYAGALAPLSQRADKVIWECDQRLVPLFQRGAPDNVTFIPKDTKPPKADQQIPAGCLGQVFQPNRPRKAYLIADPERVAKYRSMMPAGKRIVGISWHSANRKHGHKKSLDMAEFAGFIDNPDYHCVSLQYGEHDHGPLNVVDGLDLTNDIDGVAALAKACDIIVTVSNSVAHIAGALGVPCIVMVSSAGGKLWYWGTDNETIWYESVVIQRFARKSGGPC